MTPEQPGAFAPCHLVSSMQIGRVAEERVTVLTVPPPARAISLPALSTPQNAPILPVTVATGQDAGMEPRAAGAPRALGWSPAGRG